MAAFPIYNEIPYLNSLDIKLRFKTLKSGFNELGEERRKRKWLYGKRDIKVAYKYLSKTDARTLWQFYCDRYGSYEAFNFFLSLENTNVYVKEYVGTGDNSQVIWNCPSHQASNVVVYVDNVEQESGVVYTFTSQGGADSADKIEFAAAPTSGQRITMSFSGILKIRCRFDKDDLTFSELYNRFTSVGITLKGLLNE